MKRLLLGMAFLFFIIVVIPFLITGNFSLKGNPLIKSLQKLSEPAPKEDTLYINVFVVKENKMVRIPLEEYIKGVVAGEMPALFHEEALKAQAVASRTYAIKRMKVFGGSGCELHKEADVCTDPTHCQAWLSEDELKEKWGILNYQSNWDKISKAVEDTKGLILVYENALIDPVFHSTSGGKTENSEDVWGKKIPYLRSVASPYEESSPKFMTRVTVSVSDFVSKLKKQKPNFKINTRSILKEIKVLELSEGGRIKRIKIGNTEWTGSEIKEIFGLNSTNFKFDVKGKYIEITVIGNGHGVGMSQYGADGMAKNGYTYDQILKHYYQGVEIANMRDLFENTKN